MKGLKLDTGKLLGNTAGNGLALVTHTGINRIPFIKNLSPVMKGIATIAAARLVLPWVAGMAGLGKGKTAGVVTGAEEGLSTLGVAQLGNKFAPNLFPTISGYEDSVYLGSVYEEPTGVNGAEGDESINAAEDSVYMD